MVSLRREGIRFLREEAEIWVRREREARME
jgi:hypothetical protein